MIHLYIRNALFAGQVDHEATLPPYAPCIIKVINHLHLRVPPRKSGKLSFGLPQLSSYQSPLVLTLPFYGDKLYVEFPPVCSMPLRTRHARRCALFLGPRSGRKRGERGRRISVVDDGQIFKWLH